MLVSFLADLMGVKVSKHNYSLFCQDNLDHNIATSPPLFENTNFNSSAFSFVEDSNTGLQGESPINDPHHQPQPTVG